MEELETISEKENTPPDEFYVGAERTAGEVLYLVLYLGLGVLYLVLYFVGECCIWCRMGQLSCNGNRSRDQLLGWRRP